MLKPSSCTGCPLETLGLGFSVPDGNPNSNIAIVGEALGYEEMMEGKPFRPKASAGSKLEEIFRLVSRDTLKPCTRDMFLIWNVIACQPPGNELRGAPYEANAIRHCKRHFDRVISPVVNVGNNGHQCGVNGNDYTSDRVILALGNTALTTLCGVTGDFETKQSIFHLRGYVFQTKYGLVVPSFHPAYLRRGMNHLTPLVVEDLKKVLDIASGKYTNHPYDRSYTKPNYQTAPTIDEANSFLYRVKDSSRSVLTYDIETPETSNIDEDERDELASAEIKLVQFSLGKGEGIALPYRDGYIEIIHNIFSLPNVKANHNTWNFDNPRLKAKGVVINGVVHDTMWMFKHWHSRLPRGLQSVVSLLGFPFPWKHLYSSMLEWYGCADVAAVQYIIRTLPRLMKERGIWDGYMRHVLGMYQVLSKASDIGIPVSEIGRQELTVKFKGELKEYDTRLQTIIPDEVKNIAPKRTRVNPVNGTKEIDYGYIREPKTVSTERERYERLVKETAISRPGQSVVSFDDYLYKMHDLVYANFSDAFGTISQRWCRVEPFKASSTQLIRYLRFKQSQITTEIEELVEKRSQLFHGHNRELTEQINELKLMYEYFEVPLTLKTKRETTGKKELEEIYQKTGDPVLEMVMKVRSLGTNLNNYIPNWRPSRDGAVHTQWGFTASSGQKDSRRPNILNCSKHTEYGNEFRSIIVARPGRCFVEFDKRRFHIGTMGYCANDPEYIRFGQFDSHSIFASYVDTTLIGESISFKWSDADIDAAAEAVKKECKRRGKESHGVDVRQAIAKPAVLGNQLGLGATKLHWQNRRYIKSKKMAEGLQDLLKGLFPKVDACKDNIREKAHIDRYLLSKFGFIQYFYDVYAFRFDKKINDWRKHPGDDSEKAIAFPVQTNAFGMLDREILEMDRLGICDEHWFINTIHDSVIFEPEIGKRDRCIEEVTGIMNGPCGLLVNEATGSRGLVVKVDASVGSNWKAYDKESNPGGLVEVRY